MNYPLAVDSWDKREIDAIDRVVRSGRYTMGPEVKAFEAQAADHFGASSAVMVNSGSSANLVAVGANFYGPSPRLRPGDEVIVPAVSWSTTYFPLSQYGLKLRFVDVDESTWGLDPDKVDAAITDRTRAILGVHLLGCPFAMDRIQETVEKNDLILLEDCCESMGATWAGRSVGTFGTAGTFSTFFSHHICTMEGGFVLTDDANDDALMRSIRAHGWTRELPPESPLSPPVKDSFYDLYRFIVPGYNLRPLEMSGAIGQAQLSKLDDLVAARSVNASRFTELFGDHENVMVQQPKRQSTSSWFGFGMVLRNDLAGRRPELVDALTAAGVECRPIVSGNFVRQPAISLLDHTVASDLPVADALHDHGLYIGNGHHDLTVQLEDVARIIDGMD